jgi:hypothetical protein
MTKYINPSDILAELDDVEFLKSISDQIFNEHDVVYQASETHVGYLDRIENGVTTVGTMNDGSFKPL